jgi:hypothetical protein
MTLDEAKAIARVVNLVSARGGTDAFELADLLGEALPQFRWRATESGSVEENAAYVEAGIFGAEGDWSVFIAEPARATETIGAQATTVREAR